MNNLRNPLRTLASCALAAALVLVAAPAAAQAQADFTKIVAIGASVDAGFLDNCWVEHGQQDSWPAIFARQAGRNDFQQPIIGEPGLGGCLYLTSLAPSFGNRASTGVPKNLTLNRPYDNLAIPGYLTSSVVSCKTNTGATPCSNALIDVVLRGSGATVLEQAASLHPTFLIVGVLGNELLGPGTAGTVIDGVTLLPATGAVSYATFYKLIVDGMKAAQGGTGKGIVATIPDVTSLPYFTTVPAAYAVVGGVPQFVLGTRNCGTAPACPVPAGTLIPLPLAAMLKAGYGIPCVAAPSLPKCNNPLPDNADPVTKIPGILYPDEVQLLKTRGGEYNAQITALATADGYKVFDTAALLADIKANGVSFAGMELTSSYLTGGIFSYDGVHPTATGYAIVADAALQFVNANYGTDIPRVNFYPYLFEGNSTGGFPGSARPNDLLDWAAAFFTPWNLSQFQGVFPPYRLALPDDGPGGETPRRLEVVRD